MQDILIESLKKLKHIRLRKNMLSALLLVLSLAVSLNVFWILRKPGLTLAGDADCGIQEHSHSVSCAGETGSCELPEHVHNLDCYSDKTADVETLLDWQNMFADYPFTGDLRQDLVGIAKTQAAYAESTRNFQVGSDGIRRGYTRYGAWYGTPYRDWSAAFVSFCLHYAGADPEQMPGNIGANAMAEQWKNLDRYALPGEYTPSAGDLVFFTNQTVGIITQMQGTTFYVMRGDIEDAVQTDTMLLEDASISGWGITGEEISGDAEAVSEPELTWEEMLDISNGPVFFLFSDGKAMPQMQAYAFRAARSTIDLKEYLDNNNGELSFLLLNQDNKLVETDDNGNYIVDFNTKYKLSLSIDSPSGIPSGVYTYQLPEGMTVEPGNDTFILNGIEVGSWDVTADGLITLTFNENMVSQSAIQISAAMGIYFTTEGSIDFDGEIHVTVNPPPEQEDPTTLEKWGQQGNEADTQGKTDPSKIYWTVKIDGNQDSQIPGSTITDQVVHADWYGTHRYTASDMAAGIQFGATDPSGGWHEWTVKPGDPGLEWTEEGWSYQIPETVTCQYCGQLSLGNEGWLYYVNYTSTPDIVSNAGKLAYSNYVTVDGKDGYGWMQFSHGSAHGKIQKHGNFQADAENGAFNWEITAIVPGYEQNHIADFWFIMDYMYLFDSNGSRIGYVTNDSDKAIVTATTNGTTVQVPRVQDATDADQFAWRLPWSVTENAVDYGRCIEFLCRCNCTQDNCPWWVEGKGCGSRHWIGSTRLNFCQCWTVTEPTIFSLLYETEDFSLIEKYGGIGNWLRNRAELYYTPKGQNQDNISSGNAEADVPIPGLFQKELTQDFDGYTAHYNITVNEAKLSLTDGSPLYIRDEMTETLSYISGSLEIKAEDANGNISLLHQDVDYTVTYDGSGTETDENGRKVHVLDITILHPQPVKYILDYDTTLIKPDYASSGVSYSNSANITLWGETITDGSPEKIATEFNISGESYRVKLHKTCADSEKNLSGAVFGLFNRGGGQISQGETDENGQIIFQTHIIQGIIFQEHVLYYVQELQAPPGYRLDDTKYWFCFCNSPDDTCGTCETVMNGIPAVRIPYHQMGTVSVTNEMLHYDLPGTGGPGIYPLMLVSVVLIITPLVYGSMQRRKRERRGDE